MSLRARLRRLFARGARFLTVGAISTTIEIAAFNLLVFAIGVDAVSAKVLASLIALVNAYFGNRQWTYRDRARRRRWVELLLFVLVNAVTTALGALLVWIGAESVLAVRGTEAGPVLLNGINLISIVLIVLVRFLFYERLVFRVKRRGHSADTPLPAQH